MKSPGTTLLCKPELTEGIVNTDVMLPKCDGRNWILECPGKWQHSAVKGKAGIVTIMNSRGKAANQNSLTHRDTQRWLGDHSAPGSDTDGQPTKFLLELYKQKNSRSREQKSNLNHKNKKSRLLHQFPDLRQFTDLEPLE